MLLLLSDLMLTWEISVCAKHSNGLQITHREQWVARRFTVSGKCDSPTVMLQPLKKISGNVGCAYYQSLFPHRKMYRGLTYLKKNQSVSHAWLQDICLCWGGMWAEWCFHLTLWYLVKGCIDRQQGFLQIVLLVAISGFYFNQKAENKMSCFNRGNVISREMFCSVT